MHFYQLYTNNLKLLWPSKRLALHILKSDSGGQGRTIRSTLIYILLCNATSVSLCLMGPRARLRSSFIVCTDSYAGFMRF